MTIRSGSPARAEDVAVVAAQAASAATAAGTALANAATALSNSVAAQAAAAEAQATAAVALVVPSLPVVTSASAASLVPIGQGGSTVAIALGTLIGGQTIGQLQAAGAASDTDTFPVGQGGDTLARQTLAALWTWVANKLPGYAAPLIEVSASRTLDATYNGKVLVVTGAGVVLTPNALLMGAGFACEVVTAGSGSAVWGAGITATNGGTGLAGANQYARLLVVASSAGTMVLACAGAAATAAVSAPGPVSGLALGTVMSSTLALSWTAPGTGGAATFYQVQYRVYGSGSGWTAVSPDPSGTGATITGLAASTQYDLRVAAANTGGSSAFVAYGQLPPATTAAGSAPTAPGTPSGLATGAIGATTVALTWAAPTTGAAVVGYSLQFSPHGAGAWVTVSPAPTSTGATATGLAASTAYDFQVAAVSAAGAAGSYTQLLGVTTASGGSLYLLTMGTRTTASPVARGSGSFAVNANDNSAAADGSHASPAAVSYGWSTGSAVAPTAGLLPLSAPILLDGHNQWYAWGNSPATAGSWYLWFVATDTNGAVVATFVSSAFTVT